MTEDGKFEKSMISGIFPNPQPFDTINNRINDTNKESGGAKLAVTDKVDSNSKIEVIAT